MIRFRHREDEERFLRLMSEVYRHVAVHLPPQSMTVVMRNLGKMQDLLMLEGVRQGVAAAAISNIAEAAEGQGLGHLKAFQLHAHVFGSQDTPLRDVESEWVEKLVGDSEASDPWLDPEPMRFAPETEAQAVVASAPSIPEAVGQHLDRAAEPDVDVAEIERLADDDEVVQPEPALLDQVRDTLLSFAKQGINPRDYQDLVMRLHLTLQVDAGWLDLQLGTAEGRTVLAQAGFADMHPGPWGLNLQEIIEGSQSG